MRRRSIFRWFAPGLKLKRWFFLFSVGVVLLIAGFMLMVDYQWLSYLEDLFLQYLYEVTGSYNYTILVSVGLVAISIGLVFMFLGVSRVIKTIIRAVLPDESDKVGDYIFQNIRLGQGPKIVVIGGGTGLSVLLRGLKTKTANISAIVTVADDGGSSGRLREDFGMVAPGDLRNCLVALSEREGLMEQLFRFRFGGEGELAGHSFGNLFLAALTQVLNVDIEQALEASSKILRVRGRVIPSSTQEIKLIAQMEDGSIVKGESQIPHSGKKIKRVYTEPLEPVPEGAALQAIDEADAIILGPGSLYTSVMPNLLISKLSEHIRASKAAKIYICNVMTQPGETENYTVADHVAAIVRHAGEGIVNTVLVNDNAIDEAVLARYRERGAAPVVIDGARLEQMGVRTIRANLVNGENRAVHDSERLSKVVMDVVYALQTDIEPHILEYYLNRNDH